MEEITKPCSICDKTGKFKCGNCKNNNYCSKEHQKLDWKVHKHNCFPVTFGWDAVRGNELVATRDISMGEVILREKPIMAGPSGKADVSHSICLGCHSILRSGQVYSCSKCGWPLCSEACEKEPLHANLECPIFTAQKIPPFVHNQQYECLFILRCLLLKTTNPVKWEEFKRFESHDEERSNNLMESLFIHAAIEFVLNTCGQNSNFDVNEVKYVSGVINTNAMGGADFASPGKAPKCGTHLYPLGCMICHSCSPNTYRVVQSSGDLHVRAIVPIKAGQPFLTTYTDLSLTSQERHNYLSTLYYFSCTCPRCSDPTELGTFFSAVTCTTCNHGYLLLSSTSDKTSPWVCNNSTCGGTKTNENISNLMNTIKDELDTVPKGYTEKCLEELESYLKRHQGPTLHPNHALVYRAEYDLIQRIDYMISASLVPDTSTRIRLVKRQITLVKKALVLMSTFWAGYSSYRGRLLYFLQNARLRNTLTRVAQNLREKKRSAPEKIAVQQDLSEIMALRKEASKILMFDPPGMDEHTIAERLESIDSPEIQIAIKYCSSQ